MQPNRAEPPVDCRTRLMEAALLLIADKGYDGTGIREIAQKAKANSAMVQYHFGGKEGLYVGALRWVTALLDGVRGPFPALPAEDDPRARPLAMEALRGHIAMMLREFLTCHGQVPCPQLSPEVWLAAHRIWNREMEEPRQAMSELMLNVVRPFQDHLRACMRILRPDLGDEGLHLMGLSIHGQLMFLHHHLDLIRLVRGRTYGTDDLGALTDHFTGFTLRGLGVPEAFPPQGA